MLGERTLVVGILNVTPDSFSDGRALPTAEAAVARGLALFAEGADWLDVGGESTRPGAASVPADEEIRRTAPVIEALRRGGAGPISIDTTKAAVARAALDAGADVVNDVSGLSFDPALGRLAAERGAPVVLMHLRGGFESMHRSPAYGDVMAEIARELREALDRAAAAGIPGDRTIIDPGIGFSKTAGHSLEALRRLGELESLDRPVLVGPSRKSFIGQVLGGAPAEGRLMGTAAAVAASVLLGAHLVRVHDVKEMTEVVRVADALRGDGQWGRAA